MGRISGRLTVIFEDPFWVGFFERIENRKLSVVKVTFGAEPKDYEVLEFINRDYYHLQFSTGVETVVRIPERILRGHSVMRKNRHWRRA